MYPSLPDERNLKIDKLLVAASWRIIDYEGLKVTEPCIAMESLSLRLSILSESIVLSSIQQAASISFYDIILFHIQR
jgi:hypothetical protein